MNLIGMVIILAAIVAAEFFLYDKLGFKNVTYTIKISVPEAYENDEIEIIEEIENAKRLPLVWARSEISCSPYLKFKGQNPESKKDQSLRGLVSGIFTLKGYQKCRRVWKVKCEKRGIMTIENATITVSDLFGLSKRAKMFAISDSVRVLPAPADMDSGELSGDTFIGDISVRRFVLPDPFIISGAREYTGREPMKRIHWAQTARNGRPMVFDNEFTTERRVMILMNMQRSETHVQPLSDYNLELQIKAAAFVLDYCENAGSTECALSANTEAALAIPAASGYEHALEVLRALAELEPTCGDYADVFFERLDLNEFTDIFLITPFVSERLGAFLNSLSLKRKTVKILTAGLADGNLFVPETAELRIIPR